MVDLALGCALYFDTDLSADPTALFALWERLAPASSSQMTQWTTSERSQQVEKPAALDIDTLRHRITAGETASAAIETAPKTPDRECVLVLAQTTPAARLREGTPPRHWRYSLVVAMGAGPLSRIGRRVAVDAIVEVADRVAVKAGVIHWAQTTSFASGLAMGAAGAGLSADEEARITHSLYWRSHWGRIVRGPSWGTFLGKSHVAQLDNLAALGARCARAVMLESGGAYLQLTNVDEPVDVAASDQRLTHLRQALGALAPDPASV